MRDATTSIQLKRVISPVTQTNSDTALTGQIIDRQGYESLTFGILTGTLSDADATFAVTMTESDDAGMSGATSVAAADLLSQTSGTAALTAAGFTFAADDNVRKVGYLGIRRYVQLTITPTGNNSGSAPLAAFAILSRPTMLPVTQATA